MVILSSLLILTGCGAKEKGINMERLVTALNDLTLEEIDYPNLPQALEENLDTLQIYTPQEIFSKLDLDIDMYYNIFFCESKDKVQTYLIIEPKSNQREQVKEKIKNYWDIKIEQAENEEEKQAYQNRLEQSYGNHFIYIVGEKGTQKLDKIKDAKQKIFPNMIPLERNDIQKILGLNPNKIESHACAITNKLDKVTQYVIIQYKEDEEASVRQKMHDYFENLEVEWSKKDTEQFSLLKNRMEKQLGNYLIYLVSEDNDKAYEIIQDVYQ